MRNFGLSKPILSASPPSQGYAEAVPAPAAHIPPASVRAGTVLKLTGRPRFGGFDTAIGPHGADTHAETLWPLPSGSIMAAGSPLERSDTTQAFIDGFALIYLALFVAGVTAIPIGFYLLFVL